MPTIQCVNPEAIVRRAFFLAWEACGGPVGMGVFQNRPNATEDEVWGNIQTQGDYPTRPKEPSNAAYADYVFGRMMKLRLEWGEEGVKVPDTSPDPYYQGWAGRYPTYRVLISAAEESLGL